HSLSLEHGMVLATEHGVHQAARAELEQANLPQHVGRDHRPHQGASIAASTRVTIASLVTSSASASYVVSTRCRSTSGAIAFTSSGVTKLRPRRKACARAACARKIVARGLAPYSMSGVRSLRPASAGARVACTMSTM